MKFEQHAELQSYNTLSVPSCAEYFYGADTEAELIAALTQAEKLGLPVSILAGGSNVLLPAFIPGLVLHLRFDGIELVQDESKAVIIEAKAATCWHSFVCHCLSKGYYGLENLSLIPGTVGAAPIQNIGAYGVEICQYVQAIRVYDKKNKAIAQLLPDDCEFAYRDSVFKSRLKQRYVILAVQFRLNKTPNVNIEYPALKNYFANNPLAPTARNVAKAVIEIRREKLPQPEDIPNAGSFFKNPVVDKMHYLRLKKEFPAVVAFASGEVYKIAAACLIDEAGWKGKPQFEIQMHQRQALVLTNPNKAPLDNILQFARSVQKDIQQRFGIALEIEPQVLGE